MRKQEEDQTRAQRGRLHCGQNNFDQQSFSSYHSKLCLVFQQDTHQPLHQESRFKGLIEISPVNSFLNLYYMFVAKGIL